MAGVTALGSSRGPQVSGGAGSSKGHLAEVWGDVVDLRHLGAAIIIGAVVSLATYLIAGRIFASVVAVPELGRAYAMLAGLVGCVTAGVISARLFPAKREIIETADDPAWRAEALAQLVADTGSLGSMADLPPEAIAEMKELGLYELFAASNPADKASENRLSGENNHRLVAQGG